MYVDPTSEEERQASLSVTIVTANKIENTVDNQECICMIHKSGQIFIYIMIYLFNK